MISGAEVAKFCQVNFVKTLKDNENFKKKSYKAALEETFLKMDEMILSPEGKKELTKYQNESEEFAGEPSNAGCTANVVLATEKRLYVANAGDSRSVLSRQGKGRIQIMKRLNSQLITSQK